MRPWLCLITSLSFNCLILTLGGVRISCQRSHSQKSDFRGWRIPKSAVETPRRELLCTCNLHDRNKEDYPRSPPAMPELVHAEKINMAIVLEDQAVHEECLNSPHRSKIRPLPSAHRSSSFNWGTSHLNWQGSVGRNIIPYRSPNTQHTMDRKCDWADASEIYIHKLP